MFVTKHPYYPNNHLEVSGGPDQRHILRLIFAHREPIYAEASFEFPEAPWPLVLCREGQPSDLNEQVTSMRDKLITLYAEAGKQAVVKNLKGAYAQPFIFFMQDTLEVVFRSHGEQFIWNPIIELPPVIMGVPVRETGRSDPAFE